MEIHDPKAYETFFGTKEVHPGADLKRFGPNEETKAKVEAGKQKALLTDGRTGCHALSASGNFCKRAVSAAGGKK